MCSPCCRMEDTISSFSWLIALCNENTSQKGFFGDLGWHHLESLYVAGDTQTQGTWWRGFRHILVTKTIMRGGREVGFSTVADMSCQVPGECFNLCIHEVTVSNKTRNLSFLDKFKTLTWKVVNARPQRHRSQRFPWNWAQPTQGELYQLLFHVWPLYQPTPFFLPREKIPDSSEVTSFFLPMA